MMGEREDAAYRRELAAVRERILAAVTGMWNALGNYRDADAERFAAAFTPIILAGQVQYAHLTEAYLAQELARFLAESRNLARGINTRDAIGAAARAGVEPNEVYQRPFLTVWDKLAKGAELTAAIAAGLHRAQNIAATDLQLSRRQVARTMMRRAGVQEYRRKLSGSENCGMCLLASTQRYKVKDLLPIHPGCDCGVDPLEPGVEHDLILDEETLEAAHAAIAERFGADAADRGGRALDYRKVILIREHGELGPVLTVKDHHFTGPKDVAESG